MPLAKTYLALKGLVNLPLVEKWLVATVEVVVDVSTWNCVVGDE